MSTCTSCGAEIIFVESPGGAKLPLDAEPLRDAADPRYGTPARRPTLYALSGANNEALKVDQPFAGIVEGMPLYISHFATCPNASEHRKRRSG